jgi:hypothetical protein
MSSEAVRQKNRMRVHTMNKTTSIKINRDLWKQAKIEAVKRDLQLQVFVELAIRKELKR